jgi:hypothetical protein
MALICRAVPDLPPESSQAPGAPEWRNEQEWVIQPLTILRTRIEGFVLRSVGIGKEW